MQSIDVLIYPFLESDLAATGGYDDSMHYESVPFSKPQGDIGCTKGLNSNTTKQEKQEPKQVIYVLTKAEFFSFNGIKLG